MTLFKKGEHPSPEERAKIRAGVIRHYQEHPRPLSPKQAELERIAKEKLEALHVELMMLRAQLYEEEANQ